MLERDDLVVDHADILGRTPKSVAIENHFDEIVALLEKHGA